MMNQSNHPFHLVDYSPWPLLSSMSVMSMMISLIEWFHFYTLNLFIISNLMMLLTVYQWWRDVVRESTYQGLHTSSVIMNIRYGMILFIISEIFFFVSFFWTFFHTSLSPSIELGMNWPPFGIMTFNPFQIPLLNTALLLSSGITITWAHHSLLNNNYSQMTQGLFLTIMLGIYFSLLQGYEYKEASFSMADSAFGSIFFMSTGFHGLHVLIGTSFLLMTFIRHLNYHFSKNHHLMFELAAWYWHFVDVVWLFLYMFIYWWSY